MPIIIPPPAPVYLSVTQGAAAGSLMTLRGTGLTSGNWPMFTGGFPPPTFTLVNSISITFVAPAIGTYTVGGLSFTTINNTSIYNLLSSVPTYVVAGPANFALGFRARALVAGSLTAIKLYYDASMPSITRSVMVYDSADTLVRTITVPSATVTGYVTATVTPALDLPIDGTFTAAIDANQKWVQSSTNMSLLPRSSLAIRYELGLANYDTASTIPTSDNDTYWGLDVEFTATTIAAIGNPTITSNAPTSVTSASGGTVTITGANFANGAEVSFAYGQFNLATFTNSTTLVATVPAGVGTGSGLSIRVRNANGQQGEGFTLTIT